MSIGTYINNYFKFGPHQKNTKKTLKKKKKSTAFRCVLTSAEQLCLTPPSRMESGFSGAAREAP